MSKHHYKNFNTVIKGKDVIEYIEKYGLQDKNIFQEENIPYGYMTLNQTADRLFVNSSTVLKWIREGKITDVIKLGRIWYISVTQEIPGE